MRILPSIDALAEIEPPDLIVALGCPPQTRNGRPSGFLVGRVVAAAAAHHALGGTPILCSGRGRRDGAEPMPAEGDEIEALARLLVAARVPPAALLFDREAQRTIDSIDHLALGFADRRLLLVSQSFHLPRVLYLARARRLDAWGLVASGPPLGGRGRLREALGRLRAVWDVAIPRRTRRERD